MRRRVLSMEGGIDMDAMDAIPRDAFWREDPFKSIKPDAYESLGIEADDIPPGTFAALRHPSQLPSRFGGNAYGFGFFEIYDRLNPADMALLQSADPENPKTITRHYKELNRIYKNLGLLIRFSNQGQVYYLIPKQLLSSSLTHIKSKVDRISKVINFHRKKYMKESHRIGLLTHGDDLIINELAYRFKEHQFVIIDSLQRLRTMKEMLDLIILTRDLYEVLLMEPFGPRMSDMHPRKELDQYSLYLLGKVYDILKPDGEIFIIAHPYPLKTTKSIKVTFKTLQEKKNFILFTHIFKTRKKYQIKGDSAHVNVFDFRKYLSEPYVEQEVLEKLVGGGDIGKMSLKEMKRLPYLNFPLDDELSYDQLKVWPKLLSTYFGEISFKPRIPNPIKAEWKRRFSASDFTPDYLLTYLGQKRPPEITLSDLVEEIAQSRLSGCPLSLVAAYRNSIDYVIGTLSVLKEIKSGQYTALPDIFLERIRQPLENKKRRFIHLNDVLKLMSKVHRLERIKGLLNPGGLEEEDVRVLENLEKLPFFGFSKGELREIFLIVVGHSGMGRVLAGKMHEKTLKPVSDLARSHEPVKALNLLRYCRLMTLAETIASKKSELTQAQLVELFDLYETMVRVVTNREMDWDRLLDEKISALGGIHNKLIRKILKLMNYFEFLDNWHELKQKGEMEKESLSDYDEEKLKKIENIIKLIDIIERFENRFLKHDPLLLPIFYRKFLSMEFHGTVKLFETMDSEIAFILLWVTVNLVRGEKINFNPVLADAHATEIESYIERLEQEAGQINMDYLDLATIHRFSEQLYEERTSFIIGTGFQFRINDETQALEIRYIDLNENVTRLEKMVKPFAGTKISEIPEENLKELEILFSNLESFYQSHLRLASERQDDYKLPARQIEWFQKVEKLRTNLKSIFVENIFYPEHIYHDLHVLHRHAPAFLKFILPELMALGDLQIKGYAYLRSSPIDFTLKTIRKLQALTTGEQTAFQDRSLLHALAKREFGPMTAGTIGVSETQIEKLESIINHLRPKKSLFDALVKSFILQDVGRVPVFRKKYGDRMNPADYAKAGAFFIEKEDLARKYRLSGKGRGYLSFIVKYHDHLHHVIRGEFSLYSLEEVVSCRDKDLFDALFINAFVMLTALREDLILEDLASRLLKTRKLCHMIMEGETTLEKNMRTVYLEKGRLFYALRVYQEHGIPEGTTADRFLKSWDPGAMDNETLLLSGKRISALERIFRLRGIKYIEFAELAKIMAKVPREYIYRKRKYLNIGFATFEKELYEAFRIYNSLQSLPEATRHFILDHLIYDDIRLFGYENVSSYLNYENQIKLLLISLMGADRVSGADGAIQLSFLKMIDKIERRYEAFNEFLNGIPLSKIWGNKKQLNQFFKAKTGLTLGRDDDHQVLFVDFVDRINIEQKISYMGSITDVEHLKNYFYYSLRSLRKSPLYTEDYELDLEKAYDKRLSEIVDLMLEQAKKQMALLTDFKEIHHLITDLMNRSLEIGFSHEQVNKLNDLYELKKDGLRREKLDEIHNTLETMSELTELTEYWDSIKWYLFNNRPYLGMEFETLIAKRFDETRQRLRHS